MTPISRLPPHLCVQRLPTRMVKGKKELSYEERLRRLNGISLERRRLREDLILAYNILHGHLDFPQAEFSEAPEERNLRGHDFKICHRGFRSLPGKASYSVSGKISQMTFSMPQRETLSSGLWTLHGRPCSPTVLDTLFDNCLLHRFRRLTVPLFVNQCY